MILIAPDKFKGTFTAAEICEIVKGRLLQAGVSADICCRPLSDGGEGIASVVMPSGKRIDKGVYVDGSRKLVVSSEIVGFEAFSGSGQPLMARSSIMLGLAVEPDVPVTIAVGGTAVADGGAGFLQGLGVKFFDKYGNKIRNALSPELLPVVASADLSSLSRYRLSGIVDVRARLVGGPLSSIDFARQKALPGESLEGLAEALQHFQSVMGGNSEWDGAGGGIGYALASVCGAPCISGGEAAVDNLDVDWNNVEMIITGEGCVDRQTERGGKLVDALVRKGTELNIPVIILYGACDGNVRYPSMHQIDSDWEKAVIAAMNA